MTKSEIRKAIRLRIGGLSAESRAAKSAAICRQVAATEEWQQAGTVAFFSPLASEPNIDLLWAVLKTQTICYPRVDGDQLVFIQVPDRSALLESRWNLLEPPHREDRVVPLGAIKLILVPGLAFTIDGHRLGRGGGYYDRLLPGAIQRSSTFGICFTEQLLPKLPMEDHDQAVGRVFAA